MRALHIVTNGAATFFQQQVKSLESNGISCTTLSLSSKGQENAMETRSIKTYLELYPEVLKHSFKEYDIIHANYGLTAIHALAQPNLPVVLSLWGSDLMGPVAPISKFCAQYCDAVIVQSKRMAEELDQNCYIIPYGVDLTRFEPQPSQAAKSELGWDIEKKHVLFPYAADREVKDYPRAKQVVEAAKEKFDGQIELQQVIGVSHERIPVYMNAADALLITSKREGGPITVKEALACNTPVVSTDVGDVREHVEDLPLSSVCQDDSELINNLITALEEGKCSGGRDVAEEVSLDRMGEQITAVYRDVITNNGSKK